MKLIYKELYSDIKTPMQLLYNIKKNYSRFYILESVENNNNWGRYTFLGYEPSKILYSLNNIITLEQDGKKTVLQGKPNDIINNILKQYKSDKKENLPSFTGGLVGYFSYEYVKYADKNLKLKSDNPHEFYDFYLMLFENVIAFDHFSQKIFLMSNVKDDLSYEDSMKPINKMEEMILSATNNIDFEKTKIGDLKPQFTQDEFVQKVLKVKDYIFKGDIFQCVISNRVSAKFEGSLLNTYRNLRTENPSPYMFYLNLKDMELAGASPETLVALKDGSIKTYALAGTCHRGKTPKEDEQLINALLSDEKELAEHDMLIDLAKNDFGKVCKFGTVDFSEYRNIKKYSAVSHISTKVFGDIRDDIKPTDVISAILPAGTLSGAPKTRSLEIIDEIEQTARGVYGGAVGYIDFNGNMDLCIGIRLAVLKNGIVSVQSGAGIVSESVPEKEYNETINKAKAIINAVNKEF